MTGPGFLYPNATVAREQASFKGGGDEPMQKLIATQILTAVDAGLFTCTVATSGVSHLNTNMRILGELGYTTSLSGTTLTVSW